MNLHHVDLSILDLARRTRRAAWLLVGIGLLAGRAGAQTDFQIDGIRFDARACASEWRICSFSGARKVAFGANGSFIVKAAANSINCNRNTFGNPVDGPKQCFVEADPVPPSTQACFFELEGFRGASFCAGEGSNNVPAGWNHRVASVRVPAGWRVDLLDRENFGGRSVTLTEDTASLGALSFIAQMSSYRVSKAQIDQNPVPRPVSTLCNGSRGPADETPLSNATVERSVSLPSDRKRVAIQCIADAKNPGGPRLNVLRSDQGTPLRAATSWVWKPNETPGRLSTPAFFKQMRQAGLNAVRVIAFDVWEAEKYGGQYARNFDDPVFLKNLRGLIETTVNQCSRYGMYCIINAHNSIGNFSPEITRKFWRVMAPYFANRTHVIYEEANEPLTGTGIEANYSFAYGPTLAALRALHNEVRAAAPNTHLMILTPSGINGWGYVDALARVVQMFEQLPGPAIDWTNTSVAYHLYANDAQFGSPDAENLRHLHSKYSGWPSENNFPYGVSSAELNITDPWRSASYRELYANHTAEILGLGWSMWNIESPEQFARNFPLMWNDARSKGYTWSSDRAVPGEMPR